MMSEQLEIGYDEREFRNDEDRIKSLMEGMAGKLWNDGVGRVNYTTNLAIYTLRNCVGFFAYLDLIMDRENDLMRILPKHPRGDE